MLKNQFTMKYVITKMNKLQIEIWLNFPVHAKIPAEQRTTPNTPLSPCRPIFLKFHKHW